MESTNSPSAIYCRLVQFVDHLGITPNAFLVNCGLSRSFMKMAATHSGINSSKLADIHRRYPELSLHWLITGEGDMVLHTPHPNQVVLELLRRIDHLEAENARLRASRK